MLRLVLLLVLFAIPAGAGELLRDDLAGNFAGAKAEGSFVLYDPAIDQWTYVNKAQAVKGFVPASTFQVPLALIGLETGVSSGPDHVIKWDGEEHRYKQWNKDHSLTTAVQRSVVWYFQKAAKEIGQDNMAEMVRRLGYGNGDITGDQDSFWLDGKLLASGVEQVRFLTSLVVGTLPFKAENAMAVASMLKVKATDNYTLYGKGGFASRVTPAVAWQVGWVEKGGKKYFFALNLVAEAPSREMATQRLPITMKLLKDLKVID